MPGRVEGAEVYGFDVGSLYMNRLELAEAGVHRPRMAGICGTAQSGAESIVLNGGYEDDEDFGDMVIYTGQGGNDPATGRQIANQELARGNAALAKSCIEGLPVRVIRGSAGDPDYSPAFGFRYDGEYAVERFWRERGRSGYWVWRFRLVRLAAGAAPWQETRRVAEKAPRAPATIQRIIRNTAITQKVKDLHRHQCQICGVRLSTPAGLYAEGAHIRPLGRPHDGPDEMGNVLCLCPNHHMLFDNGAIWIDDGFEVWDAITGMRIGDLRVAPGHDVDRAQVAYHRGLFAGDMAQEE